MDDSKKIFKAAAAIAILALAFFAMQSSVAAFWKFNMLRASHWRVFFGLFASGKILSVKYVSMLCAMSGIAMIGLGGASAVAWPRKPAPAPGPEAPAAAAENAGPNKDPSASAEAETNDKPSGEAELYPPAKRQAADGNPSPAKERSGDDERTELQAKIKKVVSKIERRHAENSDDAAASAQPLSQTPPQAQARVQTQSQAQSQSQARTQGQGQAPILTRANLARPAAAEPSSPIAAEKVASASALPPAHAPARSSAPAPAAASALPDAATQDAAWNFETIPQEDNDVMEQVLLGSGAKLLSEIRIGPDGIDYVVLAQDGISIVQVAAAEGSWIAGDDQIDGRPMWFSKDQAMPSPVARAIEAAESVGGIMASAGISLPLRAVACVARGEILNIAEAAGSWADAKVSVCSLAPSALPSLSDLFPQDSLMPLDDASMDKAVAAFEAEELPE
jgi:hypothetical protein